MHLKFSNWAYVDNCKHLGDAFRVENLSDWQGKSQYSTGSMDRV